MVNYEPSTLRPLPQDASYKSSALPLTGMTQQAGIAKTLNFRQAGEFYRSLSKKDQANLITNLAGDLGKVQNDTVKYTMLSHFYKADSGYGTEISKALRPMCPACSSSPPL